MSDQRQQLQQQSRSGNRMTLISQMIRLACKAVTVVVMARLVPPGEHGLYVMAASFVVILYLARDMGLGALAVQSADFSTGQLNTLFRTLVALAMGLATLTYATAPGIAAFYRSPEVASLVRWLALLFPLTALGGVSRVVLTREMRLATIARIETVSTVLATGLMIIAGLQGAGALSFAIFWLANEAINAVGFAWCARWRPAMNSSGSLQIHWRQGSTLTAQSMLQFLVSQLDGILIGRWLGAAPAGLYARAAQIMKLPAQHVAIPLAGIMTSTLARCKDHPTAFRNHATSSFRLSAWLVLPGLGLLAALPEPAVRLLLGTDWLASAAFVPWLALAAGCAAINHPLSGLALATGRMPRMLVTVLIELPLLAGAITWGAQFDAVGIAAAVALFQAATLLPRLAWVSAGSLVTIGPILTSIIPPSVFTGCLGAAALLGRSADDWSSQLAIGFASAAIVGVILLSGLKFFGDSAGLALSELNSRRQSGDHPTAQSR